jgi:hypothetical protein
MSPQADQKWPFYNIIYIFYKILEVFTCRCDGRHSQTFFLLQSVDLLVKVKDQVSAVRDLEAVGSQLLET